MNDEDVGKDLGHQEHQCRHPQVLGVDYEVLDEGASAVGVVEVDGLIRDGRTGSFPSGVFVNWGHTDSGKKKYIYI